MWDELNQSELVELVRTVDPNVHRGLSRQDLMDILDGKVTPDLPKRSVDTAREELFLVVNRFWEQVKSLTTCPLRTRSPRACFGCTDIQVAECTLMNQKLIASAKEEADD